MRVKADSMSRFGQSSFVLPLPRTWPHDIDPIGMPVSLHDAAKLTGYSLGTVRRWAKGASMPLCAFRLLMLHVYGLMPGADSSWRGFRVTGNSIITPEGMYLTSRELSGLRFALDHREKLRRYTRELRRCLAEIDPAHPILTVNA